MVKDGDVVVELIHAKHKQPFLEYTSVPNGGRLSAPLVVLDHTDEYYIRVQSQRRGKTICAFYVDGQSLGYTLKLGSLSSDCGHWSYKSGHSVDRALKIGSHEIGRVEVMFYEAIPHGYRERTDILATPKGELQYKQGNMATATVKQGNQCKRYSKGKFLKTVLIHYCSVRQAPELMRSSSLLEAPELTR